VLYATADPSIRVVSHIISGRTAHSERVQESNVNVLVVQQVVGEILKIRPHLPLPLTVIKGLFHVPILKFLQIKVEAWHRAPEVPPPRGQHTCLHHLPGLQKGHNCMEKNIWQGTQPVISKVCALLLAGGVCRVPGLLHLNLLRLLTDIYLLVKISL
jgi:hypothetical protein